MRQEHKDTRQQRLEVLSTIEKVWQILLFYLISVYFLILKLSLDWAVNLYSNGVLTRNGQANKRSFIPLL